MACYWGTRGACAKIRWASFILLVASGLALLGGSLYRTIPGAIEAVKCVQRAKDLPTLLARAAEQGQIDLAKLTLRDADKLLAQQGPIACWNGFWSGYQISFVLSIVGALALLSGLLTCCCFCCAEKPPRDPTGAPPGAYAGYPGEAYAIDTSGYPDQYVAPGYLLPEPKPQPMIRY